MTAPAAHPHRRTVLRHRRTAIRAAVAAALARELETDRVYRGRLLPLVDGQVVTPTLLVYTERETVEADSRQADGYGPVKRSLTLGVEGVIAWEPAESEATADGGTALEEALDDLAARIEAAMDGLHAAGEVAQTIRLRETDTDIEKTGEAVYGLVKLVYDLAYTTPGVASPPDGIAAAAVREILTDPRAGTGAG